MFSAKRRKRDETTVERSVRQMEHTVVAVQAISFQNAMRAIEAEPALTARTRRQAPAASTATSDGYESGLSRQGSSAPIDLSASPRRGAGIDRHRAPTRPHTHINKGIQQILGAPLWTTHTPGVRNAIPGHPSGIFCCRIIILPHCNPGGRRRQRARARIRP